MRAVGPNRTILVEPRRLLGHLIDNNAATHRVVSLSGPDIDDTVKAYAPEVAKKANFVRDVTSDLKGHIYLLLSGYAFADGAPVLEMNERFETLRRFRCSLRKIEANRIVGNAEGHLEPSLLTVFQGHSCPN